MFADVALPTSDTTQPNTQPNDPPPKSPPDGADCPCEEAGEEMPFLEDA